MYAERSVPSRCIRNSLAQTLTVFLGTVLAKKYTNPSADIISVLAGLDEVDAVFLDFANALENILRQGRSCEHRRLFFQTTLTNFCSRGSRKSYWGCSIIDLRSLSNKPRFLLYPP